MAKCVSCDMPIESNEMQYVIHNNIYCAHCAYRATALLQIEKEQQQQNKFYNKQINSLLDEISEMIQKPKKAIKTMPITEMKRIIK